MDLTGFLPIDPMPRTFSCRDDMGRKAGMKCFAEPAGIRFIHLASQRQTGLGALARPIASHVRGTGFVFQNYVLFLHQ